MKAENFYGLSDKSRKESNDKMEMLNKKQDQTNGKLKKTNEYYMFEELKYKKNWIKEICFFAWFYFFENIKLKLDHFLSAYLNYAFFLAKNVDINKRKILLIDYPFSLQNEPFDIDKKFTFVLNNSYYESIERIVHTRSKNSKHTKGSERVEHEDFNSSTDSTKEKAKKEMNDEQLNIINFLKKKKIKNMIYMSDIFATDQMSIMFLVDSEEKGENTSEEIRETAKKEKEKMEKKIFFDGTDMEVEWGKWNSFKKKTEEPKNIKHKEKKKNIHMKNLNESFPHQQKERESNEVKKEKEDLDENGVLKGYDVIILRNSYEILYFYKEVNEEKIEKEEKKKTDILLFGDHYKITNTENQGKEEKREILSQGKEMDKWNKPNEYDQKKKKKKWKEDNDLKHANHLYGIRSEQLCDYFRDKMEHENKNENCSHEKWEKKSSCSDIYQKKKKKKKHPKVFAWKKYLGDILAYKETAVLDALSICSGMDGFVENANENYDTLLNDKDFYLVKYDKKLSIYRLIHAISSLISTNFKPIAYVPYWWYDNAKKCTMFLEEPPEFHRFIFNELVKDGLLSVGTEGNYTGALTMDEQDVYSCIKLVEDNNAILCSNNNDLLDYYINIKENGKVSKFIAHGSFFILTNYL